MSGVKATGKKQDGTEVEFFVKKPTAKDFKEAKLYSNGVVATMLRQKDAEGNPAFIVRSQLPQLRRDAGIWTEEHEQKLLDISKEIETLEKKLVGGNMSVTAGKEIAFKLEDLRGEWIELIKRANALDEETVEATATNSEFDYLFSVCFCTDQGARYFKSVDDYREKAGEEPFYFAGASELQKILYSTASVEEAIKERLEYKFLKSQGLMNDKMQLIDKKTGHLVDRDGKLIDEEGYYVNSNNERVDKDGNKLDVNNKPVVVFGTFTED